MMRRIILATLAFSLLIGCRTIPMATENNPTLLVGKVIFYGRFISAHGISFDGTITRGIEISLRNTTTNEVFRFSPDNNGLFHINLQDGKYALDELYIRRYNSEGAWSNLFTNPSQKFIEVERGKVNNIGTIRWTFVNRRHHIEQFDNLATVRDAFSARYTRSNWNQKEWIYTQVSSGMTFFSRISYHLRSSVSENLSAEMRDAIERNLRDRMKEVSEVLPIGYTLFYLRSEDELDWAIVRTPIDLMEYQRRMVEDHVRNRLRENREQVRNLNQ